jgi:hypothetical protein
MCQPLDSATPGRPLILFFGRERYVFMFLCEKIVPVDMALKINKRQEWVNHLLKQSQLTSFGRYSERQVNKIKKKMPKKLSLLEHVDLKQAIAEIITNPNKNWKKLKREKYMTEISYFQK